MANKEKNKNNEENLEEELEEEVEEDLEDKTNSNKEVEEESKDDKLEEDIDKIKEELEEVKSRYVRLQADFVNYKNRVEKEKDGLVNYGIETIASQILPVLDNFERALASEEDKDSSFYNGIKMIEEQLIEVLEKNGVKEIEALHEPFNHDYHHAVVTEESEDWEEGIVLDILQKGYSLNDKVIRPAMVKVAK